MQCQDGELILASQFCDGISDCNDSTDESRSGGFVCDTFQRDCYLPEINLFDHIAHCSDDSDLCLNSPNNCFQCFNKLWFISSQQVCDGRNDCSDASDESSCTFAESLEPELIINDVTRYAFWIVGFIVIVGNSIVIVTGIMYLWTTSSTDPAKLQYFIILNIATADFIMGIYLVTMAAYSAFYSGLDVTGTLEWVGSLRCSIIGSLAIISSEASCFLMVILTSYRLYNICKPVASLSLTLLPWKVLLGAAWLIAFVITILPIALQRSSEYFMSKYYVSNWFLRDGKLLSRQHLEDLAVRYATLNNQLDQINLQNTESIWNFVQASFPHGTLTEHGYYGATRICLPDLVTRQEKSAYWEYSLAIITVNFFAFMFIAIAYIVIYVTSNHTSNNLRRANSSRRERRMQRRIALIILTDFCCWIPICAMSYLKFSGVVAVNATVYEVIATFLLPINSALNPFLFSSLADKLWKKICCCKKAN